MKNEDFDLRNIYGGGLSDFTTSEEFVELAKARNLDVKRMEEEMDKLEQYHKGILGSFSNK
jgi:hypothetical protein